MKTLINVEESVASILMYVLTFLTLLQVVMRSFSMPFTWAEEASRYLMIYMIFIGSAVALYKKEHLNIEILELILKDKGMRFITLAQQSLVTIFTIVFTIIAFQFILTQIEIGQKSPALQMPMAWPMTAVVVGGLLMVISGIGSIYKNLYIKREG